MKKLMWLFLCSGTVLANPAQHEQQVNMMLAMMESVGELDRLSQCTDVTPQRLKTLFRTSFNECGFGDMDAEETDPAHQACIIQSLVSHSGVPESHWQACKQDDESQDDPLMAQLDALTERIGEREPTAAFGY